VKLRVELVPSAGALKLIDEIEGTLVGGAAAGVDTLMGPGVCFALESRADTSGVLFSSTEELRVIEVSFSGEAEADTEAETEETEATRVDDSIGVEVRLVPEGRALWALDTARVEVCDLMRDSRVTTGVEVVVKLREGAEVGTVMRDETETGADAGTATGAEVAGGRAAGEG
jgi:hypothetical protein